jgi:hypothetical protein
VDVPAASARSAIDDARYTYVSSGTPLPPFQERPPTPPSSSAGAKALAACVDGGGDECDADEHNGGEGLNADNFFTTAGQLLRQPAFLCPLVAFVASISISNVVSAFLEVREIPPTPDRKGRTRHASRPTRDEMWHARVIRNAAPGHDEGRDGTRRGGSIPPRWKHSTARVLLAVSRLSSSSSSL